LKKYENENQTISKMFYSITVAIFLSVFSQSLAAGCPKIVTQKDFDATKVSRLFL
jgi:hypothetical protein